MFQLDSPSSIKVFLGTISTAISLVEGWWRTCSFGLKDNPLVLKKKQIEDWRNLLTGVQVLRSCGFSQILNTLTFLNLPWICISCFFALCEFFKQELNPKLYWVVTDTEYWASNIFKWSTRKPPWILWHFTAGKQSTSHPNKKTLYTLPGSSKGCWMDDKGCLYTIP